MSEQNATKPMRSLNRDERNAFFAEYERRVLSGDGLEVSVEQASQIWRRIREVLSVMVSKDRDPAGFFGFSERTLP